MPLIQKNIEGFAMNLDTKDGGISAVLAKKGCREEAFMHILRTKAKGSIAFDIGANIGYTTLSMCKNFDKIYAFEPDPRSLVLLKQNIKLNNFVNKTEIRQTAMGEKKEVKTLFLSKQPNLTSFVSAKRLERKLDINVTTIDDFCAEAKIMPEFLKMDIEGFEVEVLRGGRKIFETCPKMGLLIEVHPMYYSEERSFAEELNQLMLFGFNFKYVVSARDMRPEFEDRGYTPEKYFSKIDRGIWADMDPRHAIVMCSFMRKDNRKIVRSIYLEKDGSELPY